MKLNRRNVIKALPLAASAALTDPLAFAEPQTQPVLLLLEPADTTTLHPLQEATLHIAGKGWQNATVVVSDGAGREYLRRNASSASTFTIGGALGRHTARLVDSDGAVVGQTSFLVDATTELKDEGGVYSQLLKTVLWTMMSWSGNTPVSTIHLNDRVYQFFANWIFDHTLILKGMKYFWPDLKGAIDFSPIPNAKMA